MQNLILKQGALVKVKTQNAEFERLGLSIGAVLPVKALSNGTLGLETLNGTLELTDLDGALTDACLDVALTRGAALPQGTV